VKHIIIAMCIGVFAIADELERMESIVADIENLRSDYTRCMKELNIKSIGKVVLKTDLDKKQKKDLQEKTKMMQEYKSLLDKERLKNTMLIVKIDNLNQSLDKEAVKVLKNDKSNLELINTLKTKEKNENIKNMENIKHFKDKYLNIIKVKDNEIVSLKNKINYKNKTIIVTKEICEDDNQFPELMMKDTVKKDSKYNVIMASKEEEKSSKEKEVRSKATTYRLNKESNIYDDIDGNTLYTWENTTSFTSINMTQNWLEVTGYFKDKRWLKAKEKLWVEKVNATKR
jgi:hypothetical protein